MADDAHGPERRVFAHARALLEVVFSGGLKSSAFVLLGVVAFSTAQILALYLITRTLSVYQAGGTPTAELVRFVVAIVVIGWAEFTLRTGVPRIITRALVRRQRRIVHELRRVDLPALEAIGGEQIQHTMTADVARVVESGTEIIVLADSWLTLGLLLVYTILTSSDPLALYVVLALICAVPITLAGLHAERRARVFEDGGDRALAIVDELTAGFAQVKLHAERSEAMAAAHAAQTEAHVERGASMYRASNLAHGLGDLLLFGVIGVVGLGYAKLTPDNTMNAQHLLITALFMFEPISHIILDQLSVARAGAALLRIDDLLARLAAAPGQAPPTAADVVEPKTFSSLVLEGVSYGYSAGEHRSGFFLGPVDFHLSPGEIVFITGANGSGKSTLLKLITGLYPRDSGSYHIDGQLVPRSPPVSTRALFAATLADFVLFTRSYGLEDVEPARIDAMLAEMKLDEIVTHAEGRFSTVELSTGQRKRLALVIALLRDRPIYVFDEWAADQDPEFREQFYRRVLPSLRAKGKAVVVVTHDDRYFGVADRRIHLERGGIS
ncbi:MAG: ATP-binding cassette domain-containing protein [Myxococcota bacterium]